MIHIDGSQGEGGGQILRTAVALSAITKKGVHIFNIRKKRPKPGLSAQHVAAIKAMKNLCTATVEGLEKGSTQIRFVPGDIKGGTYKIDIGTAGSISLLLQCIMPAANYADSDVELHITGGTDVNWAPGIDYLKHVTLEALSGMGYHCDLEIIQRGYYPRGGGMVHATIHPAKLRACNYSTIDQDSTSTALKDNIVKGISHCSGIPLRIASQQAKQARDILQKAGYPCNITTEFAEGPSEGYGITLYYNLKGVFLPGNINKNNEVRGKTQSRNNNKNRNMIKNRNNTTGIFAGLELLKELNDLCSVDIHLADQLIPYMGLAKGGSYTVRTLSEHTKTNIQITELFLDVKFNTKDRGKCSLVTVSEADQITDLN